MCRSIIRRPSCLCQQAGNAALSYDPVADRLHLDGLCTLGETCIASQDGGVCQVLCDPQAKGGGVCAAGQFCSIVNGLTPAPPSADRRGRACPSATVECSSAHVWNEHGQCRSGSDCACGLDCIVPFGQSLGDCEKRLVKPHPIVICSSCVPVQKGIRTAGSIPVPSTTTAPSPWWVPGSVLRTHRGTARACSFSLHCRLVSPSPCFTATQ